MGIKNLQVDLITEEFDNCLLLSFSNNVDGSGGVLVFIMLCPAGIGRCAFVQLFAVLLKGYVFLQQRLAVNFPYWRVGAILQVGFEYDKRTIL